jgi:CheY-like chemotaxis protein
MKALSGLHNTPIAFFTSSSNANDIKQAQRLEAVDYIKKPCPQDELLSKVGKLVR